MSMMMNEGVNMSCKSVTTQVYTVLGLLFELNKPILKTNSFPESSISIMQIHVVTLRYSSI